MVDGSEGRMSLFFTLFLFFTTKTLLEKGPRDGGWILGASVAFLLLPYFCSLPRRRSWKKGHVMVDGSVELLLLFYFTLFLFFTTQTLREKGHVMVDGSVGLVSHFYFYLIFVLCHADASGKEPRDGGWIRGASIAFLHLPYLCSLPHRHSRKRAT
jgi:hypothetical protein